MDYIKNPFTKSLANVARAAANDQDFRSPKAIPCSIVEVVSSGIVTVNVELAVGDPWTFPQLTIPILFPEYIRLPLKPGDFGLAVSSDAYVAKVAGLGEATPSLKQTTGNLSNLCFLPIGSANWSPADDAQAVCLYGPDGVILRDTNSKSVMAIAPSGVTINTTTMQVNGNLQVSTGASGTFTTASNQTVTVQDGIITNIS